MGARRGLPLELLLIGAVSCGHAAVGESGGPVVVAVVEVTDAAPLSSGAIASGGDKGRASSTCTFKVADVDDIESSSPSCTIYEEVSKSKGKGRVTLPCGGADGPATGKFGKHEYRGEVRGGVVSLEHSYEFREKDGCQWRVTGNIVTNAASGANGEPSELEWSYHEEILEGGTSPPCFFTCTAHTSMRLSPVR